MLHNTKITLPRSVLGPLAIIAFLILALGSIVGFLAYPPGVNRFVAVACAALIVVAIVGIWFLGVPPIHVMPPKNGDLDAR